MINVKRLDQYLLDLINTDQVLIIKIATWLVNQLFT